MHTAPISITYSSAVAAPLPLGLEGNCPGTEVPSSHTNTPFPSGASEGSVQQPPLELRPGEYRVLLCVDVGEAKGCVRRREVRERMLGVGGRRG